MKNVWAIIDLRSNSKGDYRLCRGVFEDCVDALEAFDYLTKKLTEEQHYSLVDFKKNVYRFVRLGDEIEHRNLSIEPYVLYEQGETNIAEIFKNFN